MPSRSDESLASRLVGVESSPDALAFTSFSPSLEHTSHSAVQQCINTGKGTFINDVTLVGGEGFTLMQLKHSFWSERDGRGVRKSSHLHDVIFE